MSSTAPPIDGAPDAPDAVAGAAAGAAARRVVLDSPGAVLLVDLSDGRVVHANALAAQLAPHTALPVDAATWSADAGLLDREGRVQDEQSSTLARIARGEPVTGEAVTAARASRATAAREPLWVVGLPLGDLGAAAGAGGTGGGGAGGALAHAALVVLLPLRDEAAVAAARAGAEQLAAEAVLASGTSFTISDARLPDRPLVWVNPAFEQVTGYSAATAVGRNCRFLQGPGTDRADVARVREALEAGRGVEQVLLNYRSDGTAFWNALSISPLLDGAGAVTHHVGVQSDVTAAVTAQRELAAAFERVEAARADAEAARHEAEAARRRAEDARARLALLAEVTGVLSATLDVETAGERLCSLLVPRMADWVVLTLVDQDGRPTSRGLHRDGREVALARWLELREEAVAEDGGPLTELLGPRAARLVTPADVAVVRERSASRASWDETAELMETLGMACSMVVPLVARRRVIGTLVMVAGPSSGRTYDRDDLSVAVDMAQRASLALDNVRLYAAEHATALTLQRSLLPPVPEVPGLDAAVAYLPGNDRAEVGGDWYDVLALPGGATGLAIGDVMGHDIAAAASMGQLRSVLRSYAWEGDDPATVVDRLDELVQALGMADLATCVYARLDPADEAVEGAGGGGRAVGGGSRRLVWANAGHHAPLLRHPDGRVEALEEGASVLVGVDAATEGGRAQAETVIEAGSVLLLFTDGLVEARAQGLEPGLARVRATLAAHDPEQGCAALTRALARQLVEHGQDDDVCLLAVRLL